jgi:hypothetical protein
VFVRAEKLRKLCSNANKSFLKTMTKHNFSEVSKQSKFLRQLAPEMGMAAKVGSGHDQPRQAGPNVIKIFMTVIYKCFL